MKIRAGLKDLSSAKEALDEIDAVFMGEYAFKDFIFARDEHSVQNDFIRLMVFTKQNRTSKKVFLFHNARAAIKDERTGISIGTEFVVDQKKAFDTEEEAHQYLSSNFPSYKEICSYSRSGWEYYFDKMSVFVENIAGFGPAVKVEADSFKQAMSVLKHLPTTDILEEAMPIIMARILGTH